MTAGLKPAVAGVAFGALGAAAVSMFACSGSVNDMCVFTGALADAGMCSAVADCWSGGVVSGVPQLAVTTVSATRLVLHARDVLIGTMVFNGVLPAFVAYRREGLSGGQKSCGTMEEG